MTRNNLRININEDCWKGYKQIGMKKKGNRQVPNCVPIDELQENDPNNLDSFDIDNKGNYEMNENQLRKIIRAELINVLNEGNTNSNVKPKLIKEGYTHYFYSPRGFKGFTTDEWQDICDATESIIRQATEDGIVICDGDGTPGTTAEITSREIWLNGDEGAGEAYETFLLSRVGNPGNGFTKTARRPYDAVVVSILAYINEMYPGKLEIDSDGNDVFSNPPYRP